MCTILHFLSQMLPYLFADPFTMPAAVRLSQLIGDGSCGLFPSLQVLVSLFHPVLLSGIWHRVLPRSANAATNLNIAHKLEYELPFCVQYWLTLVQQAAEGEMS